ncbi:uncharacterized protein B0H18DRAFT_1086143 [Fomitopsis serialis]|uniref:uncharacterized protein n=1 Tax=Fomitopsis serialis TaxID=139415 RepID=UPI0020086B4E|nr:uncharacterized protein B0H18DRAFT_1086143 [Neoantrodia serialis]KAH9921457.1 hypothetical protein B0H18DRAFT_1086143 [Neoantrodia serialis]
MAIHLNQRGDIAVAEIILYIPILVTAGFLVAKHGASRKAGWVLLLTLSLTRIVGGGLQIASQQNPSDVQLDTIAAALVSAGLSPLLMATLGFLGTVCENTLGEDPPFAMGLKVLQLLATAALVLGIIGGVHLGSAKTASDLNNALTLRHIGGALLAVLFVLIFLVHLFCWSNMRRILRSRRTLLKGISAALPFLGVRVAYSVLSAFAPSTLSISDAGVVTTVTPNSPLMKFSPSTGSWLVYLLMGVLPEYCAVLIYVVAGTRTPLKDNETDYARSAAADYEDERYKWSVEQPLPAAQPVGWPGRR